MCFAPQPSRTVRAGGHPSCSQTLGQTDSTLAATLNLGLWVNAVSPDTPLRRCEPSPPPPPRGNVSTQVWGLWVSERWCTVVLLGVFLPNTSQAGTHTQAIYWRRLRGRTRQPIPISLPTCALVQVPQKSPKSRQRCLICPLAARAGLYPEKNLEGPGWRARWTPPPSRTASADAWRRRDSAGGDGWSQVGREESDLWGQGASRSIWAGQVRGNRYFSRILGEYEVVLSKRDICYNKEGRIPRAARG